MHQERSSFINKLVSFGSNNRSQNLSQVDLVPFEADLPWRHKCTTESVTSSTRRTWQNQARFINIDEYGSDALKQMETLVGKSADFDLIMEDDGVENNGNDDNDYDAYKTGDDEEAEEEEEEEDGEEEDDDEEYSFNILDGDEEEPKKRKKTKKNKGIVCSGM
ncbi:hypothetical protein RUM43_013217 [Polyplax serrata]|uniref:Uncharacterized protein n=1 Tax=Polyplax serrata TaxID=468196 RepID=A0AAN8PTF2_POLSC